MASASGIAARPSPCSNVLFIEAGELSFIAFSLPPNAIESVHSRLRKIIKTRGHFPSDDAATKLIWLALRNIAADWGRVAKEWREAMNQYAILYEERFTHPVHSGGRTGG